MCDCKHSKLICNKCRRKGDLDYFLKQVGDELTDIILEKEIEFPEWSEEDLREIEGSDVGWRST